MSREMTILVTGGAGFIGSNLCEALLERSYSVVCLDNFLTGKRENLETCLNHPKFTLIEGDIRSLEVCQQAMRSCNAVVHLAALGSVPRSIHDPVTSNSINIDGFLNVLHTAKELGIQRFVFAASSSTYGDSEELPKIEERFRPTLSGSTSMNSMPMCTNSTMISTTSVCAISMFLANDKTPMAPTPQ